MEVRINRYPMGLELYMGSAVTIISIQLRKQMNEPTLKQPTVLKSYMGQSLKRRGKVEVKVEIAGKISKVLVTSVTNLEKMILSIFKLEVLQINSSGLKIWSVVFSEFAAVQVFSFEPTRFFESKKGAQIQKTFSLLPCTR